MFSFVPSQSDAIEGDIRKLVNKTVESKKKRYAICLWVINEENGDLDLHRETHDFPLTLAEKACFMFQEQLHKDYLKSLVLEAVAELNLKHNMRFARRKEETPADETKAE